MSTGEARRVCVITGAGGTLGDAFCRKYAATYDIVAVCRNRAPGVPSQYESIVDPLNPKESTGGGRVYLIHSDLTRPGEVERVVDLVMARYERVDLLVNNAAYSGFHGSGVVDGEGALVDFDHYMALNVGVPLRLSVRFAQKFWKARAEENRAENRNVVNVSSTSGHKVFPGGQTVYATSKAALNHMTRHLAQEFDGFGVRVNALAPTTFPAVVTTEAVADAVVRLDGESVTGKSLAVGRDAISTHPVPGLHGAPGGE